MGNFTGKMNLRNFVFNKNTELHAGQIADIFDIDGDFTSDIRDDTTSMGFLTESQRCATEVLEEHKDIKDPKEQLESILDSIVSFEVETEDDTVQFVLESSECENYETEILEYGDYLFLSIAYIS